jgi:hypothetical protein
MLGKVVKERLLRGRMRPRMSKREVNLFETFVQCSTNFLEFGSGGSTCLAAHSVRASITSVDSSKPWLDNVAKFCADKNLRIKPHLVHVDVGPLGDWGYPSDPGSRAKWPDYHSSIWTNAMTKEVDLILIDGRFRVACFMQAVLHANPDVLIMFHDFRSRTQYHIVREVAREVARTEDLSVFRLVKAGSRETAEKLLLDYQFEPC